MAEVVGWVVLVAAIVFALAIIAAARSPGQAPRRSAALARPIAADVAEFERIVAERAGGASRGRARTADPIWSQADEDVRAVQTQIVQALREWPALGLSRGLAEKGSTISTDVAAGFTRSSNPSNHFIESGGGGTKPRFASVALDLVGDRLRGIDGLIRDGLRHVGRHIGDLSSHVDARVFRSRDAFFGLLCGSCRRLSLALSRMLMTRSL